MNDNNSKSNNINNTININNKRKNKNKNEEKNNKEYDVYIICKEKKRVNFKSSNEVGEYLSNFRHINALTQEHLLKIIENRTADEDYYIKHLLSPFILCEKNKFGSLHCNNQILIMSNEEFSRLKEVANVKNDDSIHRKIRECLSEASSLFLFQKVYPYYAGHVINYLENSLHILNNNNNNNNDNNTNNNNNENNYNDDIIVNDDDNNVNNNNNINIQNENDLSSSDDMEIDQIIPPSELPPNLPSFNPYDDHFTLENGNVGFDGETLQFICSSEMLTDELFYSNLI